MSESDREDRTELPTAKRLRQARERGDVPRSRELANVAVLGCASLALLATGPRVGASAQAWLRDALTLDPALLDQQDQLLPHAARLFFGLLAPLLPVFAVALLACLVSPALTSGLRFSGKALQPNFGKLNPLAGLGRMYGKDSLVELAKALLRVALVGAIGFWVARGAFLQVLAFPHQDLRTAVSEGIGLLFHCFLATVGGLALLAAVDVPYQRWNWRQRLKMTKQEVRDEFKEQEGNPHVKAKIRQIARQLSMRRMMEAVPTADVVVTNPTHYAVALKYEAGRMRAPKIVAKGADEVALKIRELAGAHRVSIVEAPPLARALYRHGELDREIPVKLYAAVAQVLSYVYQLKRWHPAHGPMPVLADVGVDPKLSDGEASA
ncbi:MAG: flagellar biosynthesis protein FlhB [Lysobacteraceae bacterium]